MGAGKVWEKDQEKGRKNVKNSFCFVFHKYKDVTHVTHSILNLLKQTELLSACTLPYALTKFATKSVHYCSLKLKVKEFQCDSLKK